MHKMSAAQAYEELTLTENSVEVARVAFNKAKLDFASAKAYSGDEAVIEKRANAVLMASNSYHDALVVYAESVAALGRSVTAIYR